MIHFNTHPLANSPEAALQKRLSSAIICSVISLLAATAAQPVIKAGDDNFSRGLDDKVIALWNSHGMYYNADRDKWIFQRAPLNETIEDLYTASYVIDLLAPMLENAGAYVMLPRERDTSPLEIIVDADSPETPGYSEKGEWETAPSSGFRYRRGNLKDGGNPMTEGAARMTSATRDKDNASSASWSARFPQAGIYSLYVSYPPIENATNSALYTVHSLRGDETFIVDQTMGAGTWMRLGEFPFAENAEATPVVTLTSYSPDSSAGKVVTADAVRIGGGMGNIARGESNAVSGQRRWAEGARYWLQYAGFPQSVYSPEESDNDYTDDIRSRPNWVNYLSGGSPRNPKQKGLNIPIDLALALHTDAGVTPDTTIVGTLGIYCTDGGSRLGDGRRRTTSKLLTEAVVNSVVNDIRALYQPGWTKRKIRDRRYVEARYPVVPSTLIELLSHQNYADMTLGNDPQFRFDAARAIYKGILRYLWSGSRQSPVVQPLPVNSFAITSKGNGNYRLSWLPTEDPLEPSAAPATYTIEQRIGLNGAFTPVATTGKTHFDINLSPDTIYSFRIVAANNGGCSFPSESLSLAWFDNQFPEALIVNGFTRISAPERFDDGEQAGFLDQIDLGMPYHRNVGYTGSQYDFDRASEWTSDDLHPGHGASRLDIAGSPVAGNSFDYPAIHGQAMAESRQSFVSASLDGYLHLADSYSQPVIDLILGKQREVTRGNTDPTTRFKPFPAELQNEIERHLKSGGNLLVSGSYTVSDLVANPWSNDSTLQSDIIFANDVLGIGLDKGRVAASGRITADPWWPNGHTSSSLNFSALPNEKIYAVESADAIVSTRDNAYTLARYADSGERAAVANPPSDGHGSVVAFGFPIEAIIDPAKRSAIINDAMLFLLPIQIPIAPHFDTPIPAIDPIPEADPRLSPPDKL